VLLDLSNGLLLHCLAYNTDIWTISTDSIAIRHQSLGSISVYSVRQSAGEASIRCVVLWVLKFCTMTPSSGLMALLRQLWRSPPTRAPSSMCMSRTRSERNTKNANAALWQYLLLTAIFKSVTSESL
jgi:hypothetical protein